jgi:hypothetical protein
MGALGRAILSAVGADGGVAGGGADWTATFRPRRGTHVLITSIFICNTDAAAKKFSVGYAADGGTITSPGTVRTLYDQVTLQPGDTFIVGAGGAFIPLGAGDTLYVDGEANVHFTVWGEEQS